MRSSGALLSLSICVALGSISSTGCTDQREVGIFDSLTGETGFDDGDDDETTGDTGPLLDLGGGETSENPCNEGEDCECNIPPHVPCDADPSADYLQVMGLGCPNELAAEHTETGSPEAMGTRSNFGDQSAFPPREGERFVVLGSGKVAHLDTYWDPLDPDPPPFEDEPCSADLDGDEFLGLPGPYDPQTLPAPLVAQNVGDVDCEQDPSLVGMGDCSNSIAAQVDAGMGVFDYTELRAELSVPFEVYSLSYDLAFFSYEYPIFYNSEYNDMFIGWLESERWTGNVSFDEMGNPISLNAGYLDYRDASPDPDFPEEFPDPDCVDGCTAPELHGTCMQGHAGTKWLTTTASVTPGESITLVLAIFDQSDSALDSYVFLDNFQWGCEGGHPPTTVPIP